MYNLYNNLFLDLRTQLSLQSFEYIENIFDMENMDSLKVKKPFFKITKEKSRRYHAQTNTDADYAEDIVLLVNAPSQAETQLHSLE